MEKGEELYMVGQIVDFVCAGCGKEGKIFLKKPGKMGIKCPCAERRDIVIIERRGISRTIIQLSGTLITPQKRRGVIINDLSLKGVNISPFGLRLVTGEEVALIFSYICNREEKEINSRATVRNVRKGIVGLEFSSLLPFSEDAKKLGFLLMAEESKIYTRSKA